MGFRLPFWVYVILTALTIFLGVIYPTFFIFGTIPILVFIWLKIKKSLEAEVCWNRCVMALSAFYFSYKNDVGDPTLSFFEFVLGFVMFVLFINKAKDLEGGWKTKI